VDTFFKNMVLVEGGTFMMGHGEMHWSNERSPREVTLSDFYIGKYLVTQKEWYNVMGYNLSKFKGDDLPITNINWYDVQEFLAIINKKQVKNTGYLQKQNGSMQHEVVLKAKASNLQVAIT
jgi:formylglycine-generating enzyme required for sulfatase activity